MKMCMNCTTTTINFRNISWPLKLNRTTCFKTFIKKKGILKRSAYIFTYSSTKTEMKYKKELRNEDECRQELTINSLIEEAP